MKKVLALLLAVCVVCAAGAAFAKPGMQRRPDFACNENFRPEFAPGDMPGPGGFEGRHHGHRPPRPEGRHMRFAPDMPQEIRAKAVELEKLKIDLEEALTSKPVNKAKALEVHKKMQTLKNDLDDWRFERKLEFIEKRADSKPTPPVPERENSKPEAPDAR
ncbi:MAG: hypothetical protein IJP48_01925 [Synergistaceae bacterium]|nr:hypothetical protein [Synergistaceae bacterium]